MAASTIEPAMGASTCALGSQRCTPYIGILTMKAIMQASHNALLVRLVVFNLKVENIMRFRWSVELFMTSRAVNSGRDPIKV